MEQNAPRHIEKKIKKKKKKVLLKFDNINNKKTQRGNLVDSTKT